MIERKECYLITFYTTTQALKLEDLCRQQGIPGRLIPVPGDVKAGCGMAWCAPVTDKERMDTFLRQEEVSYEGAFEVLV